MSDKNAKKDDLVSLESQASASNSKKNTSKEAATSKKAKPKKDKKTLSRRVKEIFSELKKVSWPTFAQVVKSTGVVLVVVLFFLIILGLFDGGLSALMKLVVNG